MCLNGPYYRDGVVVEFKLEQAFNYFDDTPEALNMTDSSIIVGRS